eukprot:SAG11_NODE_12244_length_713_cov_1.828990_3_plen_54_part_01
MVHNGVCRQDEAARERINALNGLEQFCYNVRNQLGDENLKEKLTAEESEALDGA